MADRETPSPRRSGETLSLGTPADHLLLEARAANCLKNEGIETVGDLVAKTPVELLRIPNFGKRSLREIQVILAKFGFSLAPDPPKSAEKRVNRTLTEMPLGPPTRPLYEPIGLKHGISELKLPDRAHKCLLNDNLVTVGDVVSKSAASLLGLPGLGERSFREIALRLEACGFLIKNVPIKRRREIYYWDAEIKMLKGKIRVLKRRVKELEKVDPGDMDINAFGDIAEKTLKGVVKLRGPITTHKDISFVVIALILDIWAEDDEEEEKPKCRER